jgi:hypothetical protein
MALFIDKKNKRVILTARKCGLITLSNSVTEVYQNKSENRSLDAGNPDAHYIQGNVGPRAVPFDTTYWADWDVTVVIRDPYERYLSGVRTLWTMAHWDNQSPIETVNEWFEETYKRTGRIDLYNGHIANWLESLEGIEYKTLEIVDTTELCEWETRNGFLPVHTHKSKKDIKDRIRAHIEQHHITEVQNYLAPEEKRYRKWLTFPSKYRKISV